MLCVNGGQKAAVEGTWSASLEWLVGRLAPSFPAVRFAELRYRIKSWEHLDSCIDDARAALDELAARRTLLVGFSMGGAVSSVVADDASVRVVVGIAPWLPHQLPLDALAGKRLHVLHGSLDRALPGIPGVSAASSRAGFERALRAGARGEYTLLRGAVHGLALRAPGGGPCHYPAQLRGRGWSQTRSRASSRRAEEGLGCPRPSLARAGRLAAG